MRKLEKQYITAVLLIAAILIVIVSGYNVLGMYTSKEVDCQITIKTTEQDTYEAYYSLENDGADTGFSQEYSSSVETQDTEDTQVIDLKVAAGSTVLRLDPGSNGADIYIYDITLSYKGESQTISMDENLGIINTNAIKKLEFTDGAMHLVSSSGDPYVVIDIGAYNHMTDAVRNADRNIYRVAKGAIGALILVVAALFIIKRKGPVEYIENIVKNRKLIWSLSKNDFKTKYAGSYLGIIWAFVQPIVTIAVYWFVFSVGLRAGKVSKVPYALWLVSGLVPWLFVSDTLMAGTNSMIEYNYLVKKVVFNINILPIVKTISAMFVHLFFVAFTIVMYAFSGYFPDLYYLQLIYYTFCTFVLILGLTYITCSVVVFFRDLTQIINIFLQIGIWMTPIMWNISILPESLRWIFYLNPFYYVVLGYRDSLIDKVSILDRWGMTIYFWALTGVIFIVGIKLFKRLQTHFADVL